LEGRVSGKREVERTRGLERSVVVVASHEARHEEGDDENTGE
jgi:hypothetical protein